MLLIHWPYWWRRRPWEWQLLPGADGGRSLLNLGSSHRCAGHLVAGALEATLTTGTLLRMCLTHIRPPGYCRVPQTCAAYKVDAIGDEGVPVPQAQRARGQRAVRSSGKQTRLALLRAADEVFPRAR